ncbi:MAG: RidA family protein [Brachybacterium sp.]|nr:RidA family protein [Brachybacterium sp.]
MNLKQALRTDRAPQPAGPYSQAIVSGDLLFTAGFGPQDPATGKIPAGVAEQTRQVLRSLQAVLAEHGATLDDALKTTVHLADLADVQEFNDAYREFFTAPFPVRTTVGSQLAGFLVEIDLVARVRD